MARVSRKFAERVSTYGSDGLTIPSAEGTGISQSKESLEEGIRLAEENLRQLRRRRASRRRPTVEPS
jgi:hypothetical protein